MSEYVSTSAAATAVGVHVTTLQRWVTTGRVTPTLVTPGGHFRWDIDQLRRQLHMESDTIEPQPVVAAIVTSDRGVLITRRRDGKPPYGFVSGEIEPGESPADAAVRETKEETGLLVKSGRVIGRRVHPATGRTMIYLTAAPTHGTDVFVGDEAELAEVRWVTLAEADELLPGMFRPVRTYLADTLAS